MKFRVFKTEISFHNLESFPINMGFCDISEQLDLNFGFLNLIGWERLPLIHCKLKKVLLHGSLLYVTFLT